MANSDSNMQKFESRRPSQSVSQRMLNVLVRWMVCRTTSAIKYRDKSGNAWAGRGAQPRWLTAAIKAGAKRDDFLVEKSAGKRAKKVRKKRRAKK